MELPSAVEILSVEVETTRCIIASLIGFDTDVLRGRRLDRIMSTDNIDDGNDHSRVVAVHEWLHSAPGSGFPSKKWRFHSLYLASELEIPGGTAGTLSLPNT